MDTLPELTKALIDHTVALEKATEKNLGEKDKLAVSINSLIKTINEKADIADNRLMKFTILLYIQFTLYLNKITAQVLFKKFINKVDIG